MAIQEINRAGGLRGRKIVVQYEDDKGNPTDAVSAFNKLVKVDGVPAVLGPFYSGNVLACAPEAEKSQVVLLTGSATSDNIRNAGDYTFRDCPGNVNQAKTISDYAFNDRHLRTCFVLYRNVDYGVTLRDAFVKSFKSAGGTIYGVEGVAADAKNVHAQLAKVKAKSPEFIFAAVHYTEGSALLRQMKEMGISCKVMGTDGGYDPKLLKLAGTSAEGSYWTTIGWGSGSSKAKVTKFKEEYRQIYGEDPEPYSGLYYDATHILAKAMSSTKELTGRGLKDALMEVEYDGATGLTKFDSYGDVDKPWSIFRVEHGRFVPLTREQLIR